MSPMFRQLNNVWSKIPLLVWVTVSGLLIRLPCASLIVSVFNSYLALFIVKIMIELTSLSDFSSFSLVNIAFGHYLCELNARLKATSEMLLVSVIDSSSSYIMTFKIASRIFTFDNGVLFLLFKVVMVLLTSV